MAHNEEDTLPRLLKSIPEIQDIVVMDHLSTDKTKEVAESFGARVITLDNIKDVSTADDVLSFTKAFGYAPSFKEGEIFWNGAADQNRAGSYAKNDWVFWPDCDEVVEWDFDKIIPLLKYDQINFNFIHSHNPDGSPKTTLIQGKFAKRSKMEWRGMIHQVLVGKVHAVFTKDLTLHHWQKPKPYRENYLPRMEYALLKEKEPRVMFYLAREYSYHALWEKSIFMFQEYLKVATWRPEIAYSFLVMAKCAWQLHQGDKSREWCLKAIGINPDFKEALHDMAVYTGEGQSIYWKRMSEQATNNDVLFRY